MTKFQCSSASRKFLNASVSKGSNSAQTAFQCSSASRKFLNCWRRCRGRLQRDGFSALQRAENSSILPQVPRSPVARSGVSVLFSEPKIPQLNSFAVISSAPSVSVLFSEPKIPQSFPGRDIPATLPSFQCSSASRKFLNSFSSPRNPVDNGGFSALQRAENSSILILYHAPRRLSSVSVLFSEPKIPQCSSAAICAIKRSKFQCSSASRKFLNST